GVSPVELAGARRELPLAAALGGLGLLTRGFTPLTPTGARRRGMLATAVPLHVRRPVLGRPGVGQRPRRVLNSFGAQGVRRLSRQFPARRLSRQFIARRLSRQSIS